MAATTLQELLQSAEDSLSSEEECIRAAEVALDTGEPVAALAASLIGASRFPGSPIVRMVLAHALYSLDCLPLATEQVEFVFARGGAESESVRRLLEKLDPENSRLREGDSKNQGASEFSVAEEEGVIAETEFDYSDLEVLEEKE
ncbi:MAG: hypothetical protein KDD64_01135 [Bdellovibrionales bacterium]|nr:hypothetical protein [Bdellovibrionales bacterium]